MTRTEFGACVQMAGERLNIVEVAKWLGMEVRGDRGQCPFHDEKTPGALQFNVPQGYCHCHSCGESANAVKLTSHIRGIKPGEALRELDATFGLQLPIGGRKPSQAQRKALSEYEKQRIENQKNKLRQKLLKSILQTLGEWKQRYCPDINDSDWDERYIFAAKESDIVEYYLTASKDNNSPPDTDICILQWQNRIRSLDLIYSQRGQVRSEIGSLFSSFIDGRITLEELIKRHKEATTAYERL